MLFYIGVIFVLGSLVGLYSPKLGIPRVVGYLLLGLFIGPEILGIIPSEFVENSHLIIDFSLSIIAVLIGATLKFSTLKKNAKDVLYITLFQSLGTFIIVTLGFVLIANIFHFEIAHIILIALLLGAIATATDTATPLIIVDELKAKGKFTSTFLAIVALDDIFSLIIFTFALTLCSVLIGSESFAWLNIFNAVMILIFSTLLGAISGFLGTFLEKILSRSKAMETIATLGLIFIVYSVSEYFGLEPLLSAMIMGIVMTNRSVNFDLVHQEIDKHLANIIFMLFFIISAMYLKLDVLIGIPILIAIYTLLRLSGKVLGSYFGAVVSSSSVLIKKYMGLALFPQAGVAIGLALSIQNHSGLEAIAPVILNIIIATTFIHELVGPFFTRYALEKSEETKKQ